VLKWQLWLIVGLKSLAVRKPNSLKLVKQYLPPYTVPRAPSNIVDVIDDSLQDVAVDE
jgi:hypothetical protein